MELGQVQSPDVNTQAKDISKRIIQLLETELERVIKSQLLGDATRLSDPQLRLEGVLIDGRQSQGLGCEVISRRISLGPVDLSNINIRTSEDGFSLTAETTPLRERSLSTPLLPGRRRDEDSGFASSDSDNPPTSRRKAVGGLRLRHDSPGIEEASTTVRQLQSDNRTFPKRRKLLQNEKREFKPSTLDKLITSIWEQIHGSLKLDPHLVIEQWNEQPLITNSQCNSDASSLIALAQLEHQKFNKVNALCCKVTQASRCCRSLEVIVQAHWISCYDSRVCSLAEAEPQMSLTKHRMAVLKEACADFGWTEKDFRNRMAVWRGYHEIQQAGGWVPLVFAGMGLYRFCKYRIDFSAEAVARLCSMRSAFEVAADTLHPQWRQLLSIVDEPVEPKYFGHPHDWVVGTEGEPVSLRSTYLQWDENFSFDHLDECVIDEEAWGGYDPRCVLSESSEQAPGQFRCDKCGEMQSADPKVNCCACFPNLYGAKKGLCPVQVYRTANGKNNGLIACCPFDRGTAIGEFVGLVTRGLSNLDVMQSSTPGQPASPATTYQIWQGRQGNYTRFVNHSCLPNSQFERFTWLGVQRIVLVSRGIVANEEIRVDYGDQWWRGIDKICLCGEACCRYREKRLN